MKISGRGSIGDSWERIQARLSFQNTQQADYLSDDWMSFLDLATDPSVSQDHIPRLRHLNGVLTRNHSARIIEQALGSTGLAEEFWGSIDQARACLGEGMMMALDNRGDIW